MTHPQNAYEMLNKLRQPDWPQRCVRAAKKLPNELRDITMSLLGAESNGKAITDYQKRYQVQGEAISQLASLKPTKRLAVFEAIFPQFADHVEATWQLYDQLPYQVGGRRKAFRIPSPTDDHAARANWLVQLIPIAGMYDQDIIWLATWAAFLGYGYQQDTLGTLFAGAIQSGSDEGQQVFEILKASAYGEHEIGKMGRHVTRALLTINNPTAWEVVEKLLIAAQRQEGLRQVILETIDEAHPEAFKRFIRLILDNDLTRFSSVIRAVDVWFGFQYDALKQKEVNAVLTEVSGYLEDAAARDKAINKGEPQSAYLGLWALAVEDAAQSTDRASDMMLNDPDPERRLVGVHMADLIGLIGAYKHMITILQQEDDDRVAARALYALSWHPFSLENTDLFETLEELFPHLPEEKTYGPLIWPWLTITIRRQTAANLLTRVLGDRPPTRLIPYINDLDVWGRRSVGEILRKSDNNWDDLTRQTLFKLITDRSKQVREIGFKAIQGVKKPTAEEITFLEEQLYRKSSDVRRGIIKVLIKQSDENALESASRLIHAALAPQREAGLEILRQMVEQERAVKACRAMAANCANETKRLSAGEESLLDLLTGTEEDVPTLEDGLGLFDPEDQTPPTPPQLKFQGKSLVSEAAIVCIQSLDELIHEYNQEPVQIELHNGTTQEMLLSDLHWQFPRPNRKLPRPENLARLPLADVWQTWDKQRGDDSRDEDGLELVRALAHLRAGHYHSGYSSFFHPRSQSPAWQKELLGKLAGANDQKKNLRYPNTIDDIIEWLLWMQPTNEVVQLLLDNVEITFGLFPEPEPQEENKQYDYRYYSLWQQLLNWLSLAQWHRSRYLDLWQDADHIHFYGLLRWLDENYKVVFQRSQLGLYDVLLAYRAGGATKADLYCQLIGKQNDEEGRWNNGFHELRQYSGRKKLDLLLEFPVIEEVLDNCRQRIVEVEINRGDLPTAASKPALCLRWSGGAETLVNVLKAMGRTPFVRGWIWDSESKKGVFSHLIRATCPVEGDTPEYFAELAHEAGINEKRLIEAALYAPQWADHIQEALGWDDFSEAVWWVVAHTKDANWRVDRDIRETWAAEVSERTPLSGTNLLEGAVDVAWFWRVYESLGEERWEKIYQAAKYTSSSGGHKRAQLYADALLGRANIQEIEGRITAKRHRDALRALGLLPLHPGDGREDDLLHRYEVIQEFKRTSRKFGAQRQEKDKRGVEVALENLARGAGYVDPQRLTWAMEKQAVASLTDGPITATYENYRVTLSVDVTGRPELTVINEKTGRKIKNVPSKARKDPAVAELCEMAPIIRKQVSRMRQSLEASMIRGDTFTFAEVIDLLDHPVLCPMLEQLVFIGDEQIGYPTRDGLQFYDGTVHHVPLEAKLRIAHPDDLLETGEWDAWQRECFLAERIQPFKQVFRELYVLTQTEEDAYHASRRYAGHQVNTQQAIALLASRGWVNHYEEGARKTFHDEGITAWVDSLAGGYTPAELEGLTVETVVFVRRGEWQPMPLVEVPPRMFSEVMRDLDLVVSVAHIGGVDPEASASTVEMRAALIRETCLALRLANVTMSEAHAAIQGELGSYSVHLGSGVVHRQPGGALCIIPVHSQHRGRIFLPFADDDPKTAEVLSKIILLSQDTQIQDPSILEQILSR